MLFFICHFAGNFYSNWLLFLRVMKENKSGCFFSEHSVFVSSLSPVSLRCIYHKRRLMSHDQANET